MRFVIAETKLKTPQKKSGRRGDGGSPAACQPKSLADCSSATSNKICSIGGATYTPGVLALLSQLGEQAL